MREIKERIENLQKKIKQCVADECDTIKKSANPRQEMYEYIRNIRWTSPELAAYLEKEMSAVLNFDNRA